MTETLERVETIDMPEQGAMMLLRARQFKNNPHSGLRAGDVFMTRLDTKGGTWTVGETGFDDDTADARIVLTYEENDFRARQAGYERDLLQKQLTQTSRAIREAKRRMADIPVEWTDTYNTQTAEFDRLTEIHESKVLHRWSYKNTEPLPSMRLI